MYYLKGAYFLNEIQQCCYLHLNIIYTAKIAACGNDQNQNEKSAENSREV